MIRTTFMALLFLLSLLSFFSVPATAEPLYKNCGTTGDFANSSTHSSNLNLLFSTLSSNASATGFATSTIGSIPDRIYGLTFCRGDIDAPTCRQCFSTAVSDIQQVCQNSKDAIIWYDFCLLRYSNQNFSFDPDVTQNTKAFLFNYQNVTAVQLLWFEALATALMGNASDLAAKNLSRLFATAETAPTAQSTIYGLVQCAPDLSPGGCRTCLQGTVDLITKEPLKGRAGGRKLGVWCNMRYELYKFYNTTSMLQLSSKAIITQPTADSSGGGSNTVAIALAITIPIVCILLISAIFLCFWRKRSKTKIPRGAPPEEIKNIESILFRLSTLEVATANFSELNKLGKGGFGIVYKGILPDGRVIAVKRLSIGSHQGLEELKNELVLVAKLQHRNLVRLLGVCLEEQEKLLIYEYMPNKSLDTLLFDPEKSKLLDWGKRYNIIRGIVRGLLYLHEDSQLKVIHRDLKASNILLDAGMNSKISDFGMAKLFGGDETQGMTSHVVGTYGYMAPEYGMHGHFSVKSDVFSFGVLLLEIITGKCNNGFFNTKLSEDLLSYVWEKWNKGTILEVVDPAMGKDFQISEVVRCIQIGILCVQEDPAQRPTMSTVLLVLNSDTISLEAPSSPAFFVGRSGIYTDMFSKKSGTLQVDVSNNILKTMPVSLNEVSISEMDSR